MTESRRHNRLTLTLQVISTASLLFAASQVIFLAKSLNQQRDLSRKQLAISIVREFDTAAAPARPILLSDYHTHQGNLRVRMNRAEADSIASAAPRDSVLFQKRDALRARVNYMKYICTAYKYDVADTTIIRSVFQTLFINNYDTLREFMRAMEREYGVENSEKSPYHCIDEVVQQWRSTAGP